MSATSQEARGRRSPYTLLLVTLTVLGLALGAWFALIDHSLTPSMGGAEPAVPAIETEASSAAAPAPEAAAPDAAAPAEPGATGSTTVAPQPAGEAETRDQGAANGAADGAFEPSFDLIRIEPNGEAVIAGRATPNTELILLDNGEPIGTVTANFAGEWAFIPDEPLPPGDHQFSLVVSTPQGTVTLPAPDETRDGTPAGAVEQPSDAEPAQRDSPADAPAAAPVEDQSGAAPALEGAPRTAEVAETSPPLPPRKPSSGLAGLDAVDSAKAGYVIQLSSVDSLSGARQELAKLQRSFPGLLGNVNLDVDQAKLDDSRTRYRVRGGLFAELEPAQALCRELQSRRQDCLVVKQ
ncbi:MAG: SPOR domain-containing protein [Rhodospirillales bacterium]|nr:SPOR domain-containing protein [Rhodospirillales bacterium]